jgi:hypothetical protein
MDAEAIDDAAGMDEETGVGAGAGALAQAARANRDIAPMIRCMFAPFQ